MPPPNTTIFFIFGSFDSDHFRLRSHTPASAACRAREEGGGLVGRVRYRASFRRRFVRSLRQRRWTALRAWGCNLSFPIAPTSGRAPGPSSASGAGRRTDADQPRRAVRRRPSRRTVRIAGRCRRRRENVRSPNVMPDPPPTVFSALRALWPPAAARRSRSAWRSSSRRFPFSDSGGAGATSEGCGAPRRICAWCI